MFFRKPDILDTASGTTAVLAALFVAVFFWQAAAGSAVQEEDYRADLLRAAEKRIAGERSQIASLLEMAGEGREEEAWAEGLAAADRYRGNSQFHLLLGRGHRRRGELAEAIGEYRRAVESNTDRRSPFYLGETLKALVGEGRAAYLPRGEGPPGSGDAAALRDLFFIERSLAGGCH